MAVLFLPSLDFIIVIPISLPGYYNPNWNPGFSSSKAYTFISGMQALQGTLPFIIAAFADICAGDFWTLAILLCVFFVPGVLLIFLTSVPFLLGETFPLDIFRVGMQILYTVGSGGVDTICGIFWGKAIPPGSPCSPYWILLFVDNYGGWRWWCRGGNIVFNDRKRESCYIFWNHVNFHCNWNPPVLLLN
jgi:hypothetical protein